MNVRAVVQRRIAGEWEYMVVARFDEPAHVVLAEALGSPSCPACFAALAIWEAEDAGREVPTWSPVTWGRAGHPLGDQEIEGDLARVVWQGANSKQIFVGPWRRPECPHVGLTSAMLQARIAAEAEVKVPSEAVG